MSTDPEMRLYEIADDLRGLLDKMGVVEGELAPEDIEALDKLGLVFDTKAMAVALFIRELGVQSDAVLAQADLIQAEARRVRLRATTLANKADRLKAYLLRSMQVAELDGVRTQLVTVRIQQSPERVECDLSEDRLPEAYRISTTHHALDRDKVLRDYHQGEELPPGLRVTRGTHLRIY